MYGKISSLNEYAEKLYRILENACYETNSNLISLSGGLDSSIIAYFLKEKKPTTVAVIAEDFVSNDLTYCQTIGKNLNLDVNILNVKTTEILEGIEETIKILKNFNDIEIRNNVVMYLALKWAKEQDIESILTGDGADELFAGYNFFLYKSQPELDRELERVRSIMHFPTQEIGKYLGIKIESPFLNDNVIEYAKKIPSELKVGEYEKKRIGKWILRKAFENKLPNQIVWREKSPMQDGSGTVGLTNLFNSIMNEENFVEKKLWIEKHEGVNLRSKESLHYYEIFKRYHKIPISKNSLKKCPYCKFTVDQSKFCRMCGAFPI